jgi:AcrR family transcriptional regulator
MDEVAREAGVAKGTVYLYFKNKSELLLHAVGEEKRRYLDEMLSIFDESASPRERLKRWIRLALVLGATMPLTSRLLSGDKEMLAALDAFYADSGKEFEQMKFDFLGQMVADVAGGDRFTRGELEDRANVLYGLAFFAGTAADERIRSGLSLERFAELLAGMVVDGVAGSKGERA